MTMTTPELKPPSPKIHTTQERRCLTHVYTKPTNTRSLSGIESETWIYPASEAEALLLSNRILLMQTKKILNVFIILDTNVCASVTRVINVVQHPKPRPYH
ncbi:hypothetical protein AVEN_148994-1 [Araneus ventricosus]|uniref:Uncharacterized protein n=1 Tax=Araneus ventricosus TaxID=182803 RepID=A0A4Y2GEY9_ARAVE|nr:hypothetical protein AVEN_148994-1 [Araneus ventricosus]